MFTRILGFMVVIFVGLALGIGEVLLIAFFAAIAIGCWSWCKRRTASLLLFCASACALVLHFNGYKLFGAPQIHRTPPLENAQSVISLEPPNVLRFADNSSANLSGIYIPTSVDLRQIGRLSISGLSDPHSDDLPKIRTLSSDPGVVRAECQRRIRYWCGNTFFPTVFPGRLPSHQTYDFASLLVSSGFAIPDVEERDDIYRRELIRTFDNSDACSLSSLIGCISTGDPVVTTVGKRWIADKGKLFVAGAMLLVAAQDTGSYPEIQAEILRRQRRNEVDYDQIAQCRSNELPTLLSWVDAGSARDRLSTVLSENKDAQQNTLSSYDFLVRQTVLPVLAHGDFETLDALVLELDREHSLRRPVLSRVLPQLFKWPEASPMFQQWYWMFRPRLRLGRDQLGAIAVSLDQRDPFDSAYQMSMKEIAGID